MYIARDKDGDLFLYSQKPVRKRTYVQGQQDPEEYWGLESTEETDLMELDRDSYLDITWDNDPVEVALIPIDRLRL